MDGMKERNHHKKKNNQLGFNGAPHTYVFLSARKKKNTHTHTVVFCLALQALASIAEHRMPSHGITFPGIAARQIAMVKKVARAVRVSRVKPKRGRPPAVAANPSSKAKPLRRTGAAKAAASKRKAAATCALCDKTAKGLHIFGWCSSQTV